MGLVTDDGSGILGKVGLINDAGGSTELPQGTRRAPARYRVRITRSWGDYEIGGRCEGLLLDDADVDLARETATTGFANRTHLPLDPRRVFFAAADFTAA